VIQCDYFSFTRDCGPGQNAPCPDFERRLSANWRRADSWRARHGQIHCRSRAGGALAGNCRRGDCPFGCDPDSPAMWCTNCRERSARGETLPVALRKTKFVDLPVSATEDRVVGTLDIERAIQKGERHFERACLHRPIADCSTWTRSTCLTTTCGLAARQRGDGRQRRRARRHQLYSPGRFILVGTMNPEEGDLRPQLLDRFALCVDIQGIRDPDGRMAILESQPGFRIRRARFPRGMGAARKAALGRN